MFSNRQKKLKILSAGAANSAGVRVVSALVAGTRIHPNIIGYSSRIISIPYKYQDRPQPQD